MRITSIASIALFTLLGLISTLSIADANTIYNWNPVHQIDNLRVTSGTLTYRGRNGLNSKIQFNNDYLGIDPSGSAPASGLTEPTLTGTLLQEKDFLVGSVVAQNFETGFKLTSDDTGLWTFNYVRSDAPVGRNFRCGGSHPCAGVTGRFIESTTDIPEPAYLYLFGFGLIALALLRVRREMQAT